MLEILYRRGAASEVEDVKGVALNVILEPDEFPVEISRNALEGGGKRNHSDQRFVVCDNEMRVACCLIATINKLDTLEKRTGNPK